MPGLDGPPPCPSGWTCGDIGSPPLANGQIINGSTWAILGSGEVGGTSDATRFLYQPTAGDTVLTVRLITNTASSLYAKSGLMLRASTDPGAPTYFVEKNAGNNQVSVGWRTTQGGTMTYPTSARVTLPVYLELIRHGSIFSAATSTDGLTWSPIVSSTVSISMPISAIAGVAVSNAWKTKLQETTFDSVNLQTDPCATATPGYAVSCVEYDPSHPGDIQTTIDPNGHTTSFAYDSNGDVTSQADPAGDTTTYTYDSVGRRTSMVQPRGNAAGASPSSYTTSYAYTPINLTTAITDAQGNVTSYGYDADYNLVTTTDALGRQIVTTYDLDNELASVQRPDGVTLRSGYDADGNVITQTDGLAQTTTNTYDPLNRLVTSVAPLSRTTIYTYDLAGNLQAMTDPDGQTTSYSYDRANEPIGAQLADGSSVATSYDLDGQVITQTDGMNNTTSYGYDSLGRTIAMTDGLGRATTYGYDLAGNRTSLTDPLGRTTSYGYDGANRLTGILYTPGTGTPNVSYTYDADGNRLRMSDGTGTTSYAYDTLDRTTAVTDGAGQTVGYAYNAVSDPITTTYPGGNQVVNGVDSLDRTTAVTDGLGHTARFGYDGNSDVITATYPNTSSIALSYNQASDLTGITDTVSGAPRWTFSYGRTALGQVSTISDTLAGSSQSETYDPLHRLTADTGVGSGQSGWSYDAASRLTAITSTTGAASALGYDAASELTGLTTTVGTTPTAQLSYGYNADGDRTSQADALSGFSRSYGWDQADRLITASVGTTTTASYAYNGDGLRQSKTVNGTTTQETWDVASSALPQLLQDGGMSYVYGPLGPVESISGTTPMYYYQDQLGSTRALVDGTGTTVGTYTYDAYGNVTAYSGTTTTSLQYAGQYTDAETGLQYLQARYYEPSSGQFLSQDPLVTLTGQPYGYVSGDPLNAVDSTGQLALGPIFVTPCSPISPLWWLCPPSLIDKSLQPVRVDIIAHAKANMYNAESVVSVPPYAVYNFAYDFNKGHPHTPVFSGMSLSLQHSGLQLDEQWDQFQQLSGYPGANENDEGQSVNIGPSIFLALPNRDNGWDVCKLTFGPKAYGPGRHPNGQEDYAP